MSCCCWHGTVPATSWEFTPPPPMQRFHCLHHWSPLLGRTTCDPRVAEGMCPQTATHPRDGPKLLLTTLGSLPLIARHRLRTCRRHAEALVGSGCGSRRRQSWISACCRQGWEPLPSVKPLQERAGGVTVNGRGMVQKGKGGRSPPRFPPRGRLAQPRATLPSRHRKPVPAPAASWSAGKGWRGEKCQDEYCIGSSRCQHHVCKVLPEPGRGGQRGWSCSQPRLIAFSREKNTPKSPLTRHPSPAAGTVQSAFARHHQSTNFSCHKPHNPP